MATDPPFDFESTPDAASFDGNAFEPDYDSIRIKPGPPPVWPVFVSYVIAAIGVVAVQIVLAVVFVVWLLVNGVNQAQLLDSLQDLLTDWSGFIIFGLANQFVIAFVVILSALLTRVSSFRADLGLGKSALPIWGYPLVMIGAICPATIGELMAEALSSIIPPDTYFTRVFEKVSWSGAMPLLLFISIAPGIVEETFFRGYMQRRLLLRWPAWLAVLVTSLLFALLHVTPYQVVAVVPLGIWLGMIAWRAGSVWPGVFTHACYNGFVVVWYVGPRLLGLWVEPSWAVYVILGIPVLACFCVSIWILFRLTKPPVQAPPEDAPLVVVPISPAPPIDDVAP